MFWRIVRGLLYASQARLAVAFLAIASGATVCAALLNLQMDATQKLTREFRALGANIVVSAPRAEGASEAPLLDAAIVERVKSVPNPYSTVVAPFLYLTARARKSDVDTNQSVTNPVVANRAAANPVGANLAAMNPAITKRASDLGMLSIVSGTNLSDLERIAPAWNIVRASSADLRSSRSCLLGSKASEQLAAKLGETLELNFGGRKESCSVAGIVSAGGAEDSQIFIDLAGAQSLAGLQGRISLLQISVPGTPAEIQNYAAELAQAAPSADVRPVRALAEAEGRLLGKIQGLILATVVLILILTALCVLATMAALAMERRHDVGLMKALGGSIRRIMRLFLFEAGVLGLAGGVLGCVAGMLLSGWIGHRVFGVALSPRLAVVPLTIGLMIAVSIAGAFPLRLLSRVRPAEIFRGEA